MIRKAIKEDSYSVAKLIVSGWQTAYKGLINDNFLNNMSADTMAQKWENNILNQNENSHIYVYEENNKILGVVRFGKPADNFENYNSEIHVLYVEPSLKRKGIGTKLFDFAKTYFINNNTTDMIIWCLKTNIPSIKFYEKMGGTIISSRSAVVNNIKLEEVGLSYNIKPDNIYLRKYTKSDADEIIKWIKDERSLRLWSLDRYGVYPIKAEDINNNYDNCISLGNFYPMTLVDGDKIIGHLILRNPNENKDVVRLGFIIVNPDLRGKGYGKTLIKEAIKYAKNTLNSKEINLGVFENNESAYHCYKSVGFKEIRIDKNVFQFENESWNCIEMVLE